jgi:hypothetical protein
MSRHHNPNVAGREAAEQALKKAGVAKPDFVFIWGGGAGNYFKVGQPPYQYCDDEVISDGVSYTLLSGRARASWAISHCLIPIGGERIVTRSQGNIIYEIDGKAAVEVLKEYLPEDARTDDRDWLRYAISLALCFRAPSYIKDEEYICRGVPAANLTDGSITVQTEVQEGTSVWFSSRDKEKLATGLDRMAAQIKEQLEGDQPKLVFQFECATRGKMLLREQEKLQFLRQFRQAIDPDVPWAGYYTWGRLVRWRSTTTVTSTPRSSLPSVDDGRDHPGVTFDGEVAYLEQVGGLGLFYPSAHGLDLSFGK